MANTKDSLIGYSKRNTISAILASQEATDGRNHLIYTFEQSLVEVR